MPMAEPKQHDIQLPGCTPEPLMAYLKALGVLRLVSEQADASARGWWEGDVFHLRSAVLFEKSDSENTNHLSLMNFLIHRYKPTPLVAPWNGGSGFYLKWKEKKSAFKARESTDVVLAIEKSTSERFKLYRDQIIGIKKALSARAKPVDPAAQIEAVREQALNDGLSKKKTNEAVKKLLDGQLLFRDGTAILSIEKVDKDQLLADTRSTLLSDDSLRWLDAAFVIRSGKKKNRIEAPLLGSGGNIGNSDFAARFMQLLCSVLPVNDAMPIPSGSERLLRGSLFSDPIDGLAKIAVDQFDPGRAGGSNMDQGMEAGFRLNPWDYILMLEGAIVLQSAASRRLGASVSSSAFPFVVNESPSGFTSAGLDVTRGEQWLPLWDRACTTCEIETLLAEGRSEVGGKAARTGVDFARAASSLGVDRGIGQFVRLQYQARFGDNYFANSLGRVVTGSVAEVDLLHDIGT